MNKPVITDTVIQEAKIFGGMGVRAVSKNAVSKNTVGKIVGVEVKE